MKIKRGILSWTGLVFILVACTQGGLSSGATPTSSVDLEGTAQAEAQISQAMTATSSLERTQAAEETSQAEATRDMAATDAAATQLALDVTSTHEARQIKKTEQAEIFQNQMATSTAFAQLQKTEQAAPIASLVSALHEDGLLEDTQGTYMRLPAFREEWAQLNWYQWWYTGEAPTDFVVRTDVEWTSASNTANWWNSGCGFVFRARSEDDHYVTYLGLDGNVYTAAVVRGNFSDMGRSYYGRVDVPRGEAELVLAVQGQWITVFINGKQVYRRNSSAIDSGALAYTLVSGTNKDFGTRCEMTKVDLWVIR